MNPWTNTTIRSYQVRGYTNVEDKWNWEKFVCQNSSSCWGSNSRFLEIQHNDHRWMFLFYKMINSEVNGRILKSKDVTERLYIKYV